MNDLEQRQKEMRERNKRAKTKELAAREDPVQKDTRSDELTVLRRRVSELERENANLRRELLVSRQYPVAREKSYEEQRREQQHNYFKYSNIRRY